MAEVTRKHSRVPHLSLTSVASSTARREGTVLDTAKAPKKCVCNEVRLSGSLPDVTLRNLYIQYCECKRGRPDK